MTLAKLMKRPRSGWAALLSAGVLSATAGAASLGYGARGAGYDALLAAVFTLVSLTGLFAFIRGAFTLRAAADGKPGASGPKAFAHMAGGIAAWHITSVIAAVQTSLGIFVLNVQ